MSEASPRAYSSHGHPPSHHPHHLDREREREREQRERDREREDVHWSNHHPSYSQPPPPSGHERGPPLPPPSRVGSLPASSSMTGGRGGGSHPPPPPSSAQPPYSANGPSSLGPGSSSHHPHHHHQYSMPPPQSSMGPAGGSAPPSRHASMSHHHNVPPPPPSSLGHTGPSHSQQQASPRPNSSAQRQSNQPPPSQHPQSGPSPYPGHRASMTPQPGGPGPSSSHHLPPPPYSAQQHHPSHHPSSHQPPPPPTHAHPSQAGPPTPRSNASYTPAHTNGAGLPPPPGGLTSTAVGERESRQSTNGGGAGSGSAAAGQRSGGVNGHPTPSGPRLSTGSNSSMGVNASVPPGAGGSGEGGAMGPPGSANGSAGLPPPLAKLNKEYELTWLKAGNVAEKLEQYDRALDSYQRALVYNAKSPQALTQIASIYRHKEMFGDAAKYFSLALQEDANNGEVWGALGHCYLMVDELQQAYGAYQKALFHMNTAHQEPKLWYGIGILYDRYGSLDHAEEAFSSVIRKDPNFEKATEIYFRLGIIYKQQRKSEQSLECFRYILDNPPKPLTGIDIWFQIGHVYEQQGRFGEAKDAYERVLKDNPTHAKVLQQLGGLFQRSNAPFYDPNTSVSILTKSLESDATDPLSWYLLGRAYMSMENYGKAYEAYQQAVYRDGKNPAFWCSIGVLYYAINQYRDALDAYSRAIRIQPYLPEVWFNLGALYESCADQIPDAIDAYNRASQLDPKNTETTQRLKEITEHKATGAPIGRPPVPRDVDPNSGPWPGTLGGPGGPPTAHDSMDPHDPLASGHTFPIPGGHSAPGQLSPLSVPPRGDPLTNGTSSRDGHGPPAAPAGSSSLQSYRAPYGPAETDAVRRGSQHPLAPMEAARSPRSVQLQGPHSLPHIRSVYDSRMSPAPSVDGSYRRPAAAASPTGTPPRPDPRRSPEQEMGEYGRHHPQYAGAAPHAHQRPPPPPESHPSYMGHRPSGSGERFNEMDWERSRVDRDPRMPPSRDGRRTPSDPSMAPGPLRDPYYGHPSQRPGSIPPPPPQAAPSGPAFRSSTPAADLRGGERRRSSPYQSYTGPGHHGQPYGYYPAHERPPYPGGHAGPPTSIPYDPRVDADRERELQEREAHHRRVEEDERRRREERVKEGSPNVSLTNSPSEAAAKDRAGVAKGRGKGRDEEVAGSPTMSGKDKKRKAKEMEGPTKDEGGAAKPGRKDTKKATQARNGKENDGQPKVAKARQSTPSNGRTSKAAKQSQEKDKEKEKEKEKGALGRLSPASVTSTTTPSSPAPAPPAPTVVAPVAPTRQVDEDYDEGAADALMGLASGAISARPSVPPPPPRLPSPPPAPQAPTAQQEGGQEVEIPAGMKSEPNSAASLTSNMSISDKGDSQSNISNGGTPSSTSNPLKRNFDGGDEGGVLKKAKPDARAEGESEDRRSAPPTPMDVDRPRFTPVPSFPPTPSERPWESKNSETKTSPAADTPEEAKTSKVDVPAPQAQQPSTNQAPSEQRPPSPRDADTPMKDAEPKRPSSEPASPPAPKEQSAPPTTDIKDKSDITSPVASSGEVVKAASNPAGESASADAGVQPRKETENIDVAKKPEELV